MNPKLKIIFLIIIIAVAFHLRFTRGYLRSVNTGITFITPDPYYHLRRIVLTAQNYPQMPTFDYYLSYPTGTYCIWPPLFDFGCATMAYTIGLGSPSVELTESIAAIYPVLFALSVVLLTYLIGKEVFNDYVGIVGAGIVAFLPASVMFSAFGFTDHHIAESFALLLIFYFALKQKEELRIFILLGLSIGIALLLWQGSILFAGIIFLYMFFSNARYKYAVFGYILPVLIILPFSLGGQHIGGHFTHRALSLLQVSLLVFASIFLFLKYMIANRKIFFSISGFIVIFLLIIAFLFFPQWREAVNFVTKNVWTQTIVGYQTIMSLERGFIRTTTVNNIFGRAYYFWPVILVLIALDKEINKKWLFIYITITIGILNFLVTQYSVWFAPIYALVVGYLLYFLYTFLCKRLLKKLMFLIVILIGIIVFIIFQPVIFNYSFTFEDFPNSAEYFSCKWLRDYTESPGDFSKPSQIPEYGVMSFYKHGHFIIYIGQRPAIGNNFGKDGPNFDIPNMFMLSQTEEEANKLLSEYNARYIFCDANLDEMLLATKFLGYEDYFGMYPTVTDDGTHSTAIILKMKAIKAIYHRLYKFDGCAVYINDSIYIEPIRRSRLIYVSPYKELRSIKIFEFVKGAKIKGRTSPQSPVLLFIEPNILGADIIWSDSLKTDADGNFIFTCPYNTDIMPAVVISGKETTEVFIPNDYVLNGDTIRLHF